MMRYFIIGAYFLFAAAVLSAQPSSLAFKEQINKLEAEAANGDSELLLQLAKVYFQDQNQERAFATFLKAVEKINVVPPTEDADGRRLYEEALAVYLDPHAQSTRDTAAAILEKYAGTVKEHPNYTQLTYLVAASYANVGQFNEFFDLFVRSYKEAPSHYLAHKTLAIIHIKLLERAATPEAKEREREQIIAQLAQAMTLYPQDHTLYKMMVAFAPERDKSQVVKASLKKIVDGNIVVPRTDIGFYVEEAAKAQQYEDAQRLLDKAREWYQYSRIINTAQQYLDQQRKRA